MNNEGLMAIASAIRELAEAIRWSTPVPIGTRDNPLVLHNEAFLHPEGVFNHEARVAVTGDDNSQPIDVRTVVDE